MESLKNGSRMIGGNSSMRRSANDLSIASCDSNPILEHWRCQGASRRMNRQSESGEGGRGEPSYNSMNRDGKSHRPAVSTM